MTRDLQRYMHFTIARVAAFLDCSQSHIRNLISEGELKAIRVGSSVRVGRASLDDFLERNEIGPIDYER